MTLCRRLVVAGLLGLVFPAYAAASAQEGQAAPEGHRGRVLFSGPPANQKTAAESAGGKITDAERTALVITAWDLDVHLAGRQQSLEAHARVTVADEGDAPLAVVALQISSTLKFEQVGLHGRKLPFAQSLVASDADHTGQLQEAAIRLPEPLAPKARLVLDVDYGGMVPLSAQRLTAIGAPDAQAEASDWDRVSEDFIGLRGFGNVVWYPVSSVPVSLAKGAQLFTEIGRQKLMDQDATASLRVTEEFSGEAPTAAVLDGRYVALDHPTAMPSGAFPGVVTCSVPERRLGFEVPSLFLARRTVAEGNGVRVLALDGDAQNAQTYLLAGRDVSTLLRNWLGPGKHEDFTVLELPEAGDAPAEVGDVLATPLSADPATKLTGIVAHGMAHAAFRSPRGWLNEGVANFVSTLWVESTDGKTAALEKLNGDRPALALAEPGTPGEGSGEDLEHAVSAVYYRTKATYVLWMLREMVGDKAVQAALQTYDPAKDTQPEYFEGLVENASGKDLRWFFDNWVYKDRGLPDLSIAGVYPTPEAHQQVLVAVDIMNEGYAEAEVPVTVKGIDTSATQLVRVPAHGRVTYRVTFQENPAEVDVNDGSVPEVEDSIHRRAISY